MSLRARLLAAFAYTLLVVLVALELPLANNLADRIDAEVRGEAAEQDVTEVLGISCCGRARRAGGHIVHTVVDPVGSGGSSIIVGAREIVCCAAKKSCHPIKLGGRCVGRPTIAEAQSTLSSAELGTDEHFRGPTPVVSARSRA